MLLRLYLVHSEVRSYVLGILPVVDDTIRPPGVWNREDERHWRLGRMALDFYP